ncbi:MAG: ComEC/Rec2 family competence protein [Planctomycetes bacterium]|nr:ComEC/Rec2 family competence protein [Planctomycetota bacterium]
MSDRATAPLPSDQDQREPSRVWRWRDALARAPLMVPAVGLVLGIAADDAWALGPVFYVAFFLLGSVVWFVPAIRGRVGLLCVVVPAVAVGGLLHHNAYRRVAADHLVHWTQADAPVVARVVGTVWTEPRLRPGATGPFAGWMHSPDRTSFAFRAEAIEADGQWVPVTGQVGVSVKEAVLDVGLGDRVELFGYLYRPLRPDNPGQYDWARWKRRHGQLVGLTCNHAEAVRMVQPSVGGSWRAVVAGWRKRARGLLLGELSSYAGPERSLLGAMILAARSGLDPAVHQAFVRTGASHYLAVSGFHVGMLAFFFYAAGRLLGLTRRRSALLVVAATVFYAVLAEPRPPILRATVLAVAICAALIFGWRRAYFNWLGLSAICFVVLKPTVVFDVGFQMSYLCVLGILLLAPAIRGGLYRLLFRSATDPAANLAAELRSRDAATRRWRLRLNRWLLLPLSVTLAAWLSSLPLLVATFQQFSPWGWLNTLLVYPLVVVVMFLGFAALLVGLVSGLLAGVLTALLEPAAGLLIAWVSWLGMIPGVLVHTTSPPSAWVWLFYAGLAAWAAVHHRLVGLRLGLAVTVAWLVATAVWVWPTPPGGRLTMTVLSVGRGTSIIIELPEGGVVLYDAGSSGSYDPGPGTILPFLAYRGIGQIEAAIISHPNLDHFGGLPSVADGIDVGSVMLSSHFEPLSRRTQEGAGRPTKPSWKLLKEIERRGLETLTIDSSTGPFEIGGASFEILWPPPTPPFELTANDSSLVIRVTHRGRRILLTGDIEDGAQGYLLSSGVDLSADVLLLPHHGSVRRSSRAFVEAVAPELVIRSASQRSADSSTGLREVIGDRRALNTADVGAIEVILDGDGVHWSAFHADPGETSAGQPASPR